MFCLIVLMRKQVEIFITGKMLASSCFSNKVSVNQKLGGSSVATSFGVNLQAFYSVFCHGFVYDYCFKRARW